MSITAEGSYPYGEIKLTAEVTQQAGVTGERPKNLDDVVTVYRGVTFINAKNVKALSRTLDRDTAEWFAHRFGGSRTVCEAPLQQTILAAIRAMFDDKSSLIGQITSALKAEVIPFPGGGLSLGDIDRRLAELEVQFQKLLAQATENPAAYSGQFKEIPDEQTFPKEKRTALLAEDKSNAEINQKIADAAVLLDRDVLNITEWDESIIRQMVETVKVMSKNDHRDIKRRCGI